MLEALKSAGLLSLNNKQIVEDMLYACRTIFLRKNYDTSKPQTDEYAQLAGFMQRLAIHNLLSVKVCHYLFGVITWQQQLSNFENALDLLQPLSKKKINFVLSSPDFHAGLIAMLSKMDNKNILYPWLAETVAKNHILAIMRCIRDGENAGYFNWLTPELFQAAVSNFANMEIMISAYHALHRVGRLASDGHYVTDKPHFAAALKLISHAASFTAECVPPAIENDYFVEAMQVLFDYNLIATISWYEFRGRAEFNSRTSAAVTQALLKSPELCQLLIRYHASNNQMSKGLEINHRDFCRADLKYLLYVNIPLTAQVFKNHEQLITPGVVKRVDEIQDILSQAMSRKLR
jgi:hypothetical protein